ncbi:hypothetical protein JW707_05010 [Candidatus Woesearchaeota archaeon]|nr:hypothetical protein [Candidatus Woesearchaeota archaeon]
MLKKKGQQSGAQAAILIGIIAAILIAYILFLPPEEREELLEDGTGTASVSADEENITLLNATSMRLEYVGAAEYEHTIPNVYLSEKTEAEVIEAVNPFYIRNGWFDKKTENVTFYITDLKNTGNVGLSFEAPKAKGKLMISLNGVQVFEYEVSQLNVGPIELRNELLKEGENNLVFSVGGVGIKFWTTNEYSIEDLQVTGDIRDISQQESRNIFTITNDEYYNIESARLDFYPVCTQQAVGRLQVLLNNREVFSAVPDCESMNRQDIFTTELNPGKNTLVFKTDKGNYRIELIKVKTDLKDVKTYLDYFDINSTSYDEIVDGDKDVWLEINFVDDDEDKEAEINVNGHLAYLDQKTAVYRRNINTWVEEGARNYVEIKPKTVLKIVDLKVTMNDK